MPLLAAEPVTVSPERRPKTGTTGTNPFDATTVGPSCSDHVGCGGRSGCARECRGARRLAQDRSPLAQAVAERSVVGLPFKLESRCTGRPAW